VSVVQVVGTMLMTALLLGVAGAVWYVFHLHRGPK
jgi:hypothetical protein